MDKQEVVEIMTTFVHEVSIQKAKDTGATAYQSLEGIEAETIKNSIKETCANLYDVMDAQGLIVKP
jgi:hypothetical protein